MKKTNLLIITIAFIFVQMAPATIVYSGALNEIVNYANPVLDLTVDGSAPELSFTVTSDMMSSFFKVQMLSDDVAVGVSSSIYVEDFVNGSTIGGKMPTISPPDETEGYLNISIAPNQANWRSGDIAYVGFRFDLDDGAGATVYGWAQIEHVGTGPNYGGILHGWAYEDSGSNIAAGAVPEPATAGLLAGAGLVIAAYRRIRKTYGIK